MRIALNEMNSGNPSSNGIRAWAWRVASTSGSRNRLTMRMAVRTKVFACARLEALGSHGSDWEGRVPCRASQSLSLSFMRTVTSRTGTNLAERFAGSLVDPGASDTAGITCRRPRSEARTGEALYGPGLSGLSRFPKHHSSGSSTRAGTWGHE
jgi:hypothetical protein